MDQRFRRQLLALGRHHETVEEGFRSFLRDVMRAAPDERPTTEGVLDVLQAVGIDPARSAAYATRFEDTLRGRAA